ncbi:MAG: hypothetical protein RLZZ78_1270 [Armatimonadota bacterium]|jgi:hypothetical protein
MKPMAMALAGGTAIVAAIAGWELRSAWLAKTLQILPPTGTNGRVGELPLANLLPDECGGYRRVSTTESGRQQIFVRGKATVSLFIPGSSAADIAAAPGWSVQTGSDGSAIYTMVGKNDHCAVAFTFENQPIVLASRIKTGRLIELAESMKQAMRKRK